MKRIEALLDAFARMYGWHDPQSKAYKLRNPLMLKAFSPKHAHDEEGNRVFGSFPSGYDNGLIDLKIKCSGESRSKLTPENTINDLVCTGYGLPPTATRYITNFLHHIEGLELEDVTANTSLSFFLEK